MKKLIFTLQKQQMPHYEPEHNWLGFKTIEILHFNYDGKGNALILEDGEISYSGDETLRFIFFSGWYKLKK